MIFDDLLREYEERNRPPPDPQSATVKAAARWWLWHDRARAMTHTLYADHGWQVLTEGPVDALLPIPGVAMIEAGVAREVGGDEASVEGAKAGIAAALTEIRSTLTDALRTLPRPLQPLWSGSIPLPPEDQP